LVSRRTLAHWAAPAAFLVAVTIAVLLIRAGLQGGGGSTTNTVPTVTRAPAPAAATTRRTRPRKTTTAAAEYYTVQSGDTFGSIAARYGTSVARLEALNPGVSSSSLSIGQKIRVK
jgi:LysM repeat protein